MLPQNSFVAALVVALATLTAAAPAPNTQLSVRAVSKVTNPAVAVSTVSDTDGAGAGSDTYKMYTGTGTTAAGWPGKDQWVSFNDMFNANKAKMLQSCSQFNVPNDSDAEIDSIRSAIESVAQQTLVDHRYILAVIMQESGGCVRVPTTNYGVRNPGLMQDHDGAGTCSDGGVKNPCPDSEIKQMITDGTAGTTAGDGLAGVINTSGASDVSAFYKGARIYNSGSIAANGDLGAGIATHCYASDIANRLTGWVKAPHGCTLDGAA